MAPLEERVKLCFFFARDGVTSSKHVVLGRLVPPTFALAFGSMIAISHSILSLWGAVQPGFGNLTLIMQPSYTPHILFILICTEFATAHQPEVQLHAHRLLHILPHSRQSAISILGAKALAPAIWRTRTWTASLVLG